MELPEQFDPIKPWSPTEVQVLLQLSVQRIWELGETEKDLAIKAADRKVIYESRLAQFKLIASIRQTVDIADDQTGEIHSTSLGTVGEREAWAQRQCEGYRQEFVTAEAIHKSAIQAVRITMAQADSLRSIMATARESDGLRDYGVRTGRAGAVPEPAA